MGKGYVVWRVGGRGSILKRGIKIPLRGRKKHVCAILELLKILLLKDSSFFQGKLGKNKSVFNEKIKIIKIF